MFNFFYTRSITKALDILESEAKIIEVLFYEDSLSISQISHRTKINRSTCYKYIYNLSKKDLVSTIIKNGKRYIKIKNFVQISSKLKDSHSIKYKESISALNHLEKIYENLSARAQKSFNKPKIDIFEGESSLHELYKISLEGTFMCAYFNPWKDTKNRKIDDWHTKQRETMNIPLRVILPQNSNSVKFSKIESKLKESLLIPNIQFRGMKIITNKHVISYSDFDKLGTCIFSEYLSENELSLFNYMWDSNPTIV